MLPVDRLPSAPDEPPIALLAGVKVLDLTTSIAGPYCSMLLADMGAEVVKIERPGRGDDARAWGPPFLGGESLWFVSVNRNKHSVTLDYGAEAGRPVLHDLVRACDVILVNLVQRAQVKLGVDAAALASVRPDLVHVSITGFGLDGARKDMTCYDLIAEGYSGVMDVTGEAASDPQKIGTPAADLIAGMDAAYATLAALLDRARSGRGHRIDISMIDSMTRFMAPRIVPYLGSGDVPQRTGAKDSVIAVYQTFAAADGMMTLGLGNDGIWQRFWAAVGRPEYGADPRFATSAKRHAARAEIVAEIAALLKARPRAHWLALFAEHKVPAGPVNRIDEVSADPLLIGRGLFYAVEARGKRIPQVGLGVTVDGSSASLRSPPPALGEHTERVLGEWLGYDSRRLDALRSAKVI
ncbi:MAG TPA: CoA transferase [Burkholderiales bacterium]|nr:CoA transferase [Burkholderiales bacterium]